MNSYPSIENVPHTPTISDGSLEAGILSYTEYQEDDEGERVDCHRVARISRGQARYEGALSEAAARVGQLPSDLAY